MAEVYITTPVVRMVAGSLYKPRDKAYDGSPLVYKHGPDAGKPRTEFVFRVAFPKTRDANGQVQHWAHTEFGSKLWQAVHSIMPNAGQIPSFKWKVRDGDQPVMDEKTGRPFPIREGCAGHWVVKFSGGFAPGLFNGVGAPDPKNPPPFPQEDGIFPGCWVQVHVKVKDNGAKGDQLGVYLNPAMVCLQGYGPAIVSGPDVGSAGFGASQLPAGASMTPVGQFAGGPPPALPGAPAMPQMAPQTPGMPPNIPAAYAAPQAQPQYTPPTGMPAPGTIPPNPAFLQVPGAGQQYAQPQMPPPGPAGVLSGAGQQYAQPPMQQYAPPPMAVPGAVPGMPVAPSIAPPARQMLPGAMGIPYEAWRASNWTDEMLVRDGKMAA